MLCALLLFSHINSPASPSQAVHPRACPSPLQHLSWESHVSMSRYNTDLQFLLFILQTAYISLQALEREDIPATDTLKSLWGFPMLVPCRHFFVYMQEFEVTPLKPCFHYVFSVSCTILGSVLVNSVHHCLPGLPVVPSLSFLVSSAYWLSKTNVLIIYKGIYLCHFKFWVLSSTTLMCFFLLYEINFQKT